MRLKPEQHNYIRLALIFEMLSGFCGALGVAAQILLYQIPAGRRYRGLILLGFAVSLAFALAPLAPRSLWVYAYGVLYPGILLCYVTQLWELARRTKWLDVIGRLRRLIWACTIFWLAALPWMAGVYLGAPLVWLVPAALPLLAFWLYIVIQLWGAMAEMIRTARLRERVSAGGSRRLRRPPPPRTRTEAS